MNVEGSVKERLTGLLDELIVQGQKALAQVQEGPGQTVPDWRFHEAEEAPVPTRVDTQWAIEWQTRCRTILDAVLPKNHLQRENLNTFNASWPSYDDVRRYVAFMKAVKADMEAGLFDDVRLMVRAEIAGDYMAQAELLHGEGYHVPAAVLAGAVLEDALRKLCEREEIPIETDKGKRKTINPMNTDLAKKNVYNAAKAQEILAWAALRNNAAHGDGDKVEPAAVGRMIDGVRAFVADYLR